MPEPLLSTKLYAPPTRRELVPRHRLIERLNAGLGEGPDGYARKLTLISAPAGFGKTTLVSAWLQHLRTDGPQRSSTWLSLDSGDNDPLRFLAYLVAALQEIDDGMGRDLEELLVAGQLPPKDAWVGGLINDIAATQASFMLVLDDYHAIAELVIHEAIEFLLERQPPQMHLVIITRQDPALPLSRLRARGQLTEIRQDELRFTHEEAAAFLNGSMGLNLTASEIAVLEERTESWVAGLQMAALALQPLVARQQTQPREERDAEPTEQFIASFSGRHHFILDYLTDEIMRRQPGAVQTFLLATSILDRMSGPLCDAVVGGEEVLPEGGQAMLERLHKANLFVVPLDDERRWYRYHRLFAELLHARLRETRGSQVPELHRRASTWYEENGLASEAIHHVLAAKDFRLAADVIERTIRNMATLSRIEIMDLLAGLKALPDEVLHRRPLLWLFTSRLLFATGQLPAAVRMLDEVERALLCDRSPPDSELVLNLIVADRASYAAVRGDVQQAKEYAERALEQVADDDTFGRIRALALLGMAHSRSGDVLETHQAYTEAIATAQAAGVPFAAVTFASSLGDLWITRGQLRQAHRTCELADRLGTVSGKRISPAGFVELVRGKILYERNDLLTAERALLDGLKLLSRGGIAEHFGNMRAVLALVKQAQGDAEGALADVERAVHLARGSRIPRLLVSATAYRARVWLAQGNLEMAAQWAHHYRQHDETEYLREFEDLTLARVLLAIELPDDALASLGALLPPAVHTGRMGVVLEGQSLRALALHALGNLDEALDALASSLALAEPEDYVRVFVDSGESMRTLLKRASSAGIAPAYAARLLAAYGAPQLDSVGESRALGQPLIEPLSDRELEVLGHLAGGLSNREIARRLFVSLPTVKSHTRNIYGKLGVHSRAQAVDRARALGLL